MSAYVRNWKHLNTHLNDKVKNMANTPDAHMNATGGVRVEVFQQ